jgi:hypothetical protein
MGPLDRSARMTTKRPVRAKGMRVNTYNLLSQCVDDGIAAGWRHAHKHVEHPDEAVIAEHLSRDIMNEVCEWFEFDE